MTEKFFKLKFHVYVQFCVVIWGFFYVVYKYFQLRFATWVLFGALAIGPLFLLFICAFNWNHPEIQNDRIVIKNLLLFWWKRQYLFKDISYIEFKPNFQAVYIVYIVTLDGKKHFKGVFGNMPIEWIPKLIASLREKGVEVRDHLHIR